MVAKIGLTTDTIRDVADVATTDSSINDSSLSKKFAVFLNSIATAVSLFFVSGLGLRLNVVNRLLTDKKFSESFMDGAYKYVHDKHAAEYAKATFSPENFRDIWPNTKNHYRLTFGLAKELKGKGVEWTHAWKGLTSLEKIGVIVAPVVTIGWLGNSVYSYFKKPKANIADNEIMISGPVKLMEDPAVYEFITKLNEKGIPVGESYHWPNNKSLGENTFHGITTGEFIEKQEKNSASTASTAQKTENFVDRISEDKERSQLVGKFGK